MCYSELMLIYAALHQTQCIICVGSTICSALVLPPYSHTFISFWVSRLMHNKCFTDCRYCSLLNSFVPAIILHGFFRNAKALFSVNMIHFAGIYKVQLSHENLKVPGERENPWALFTKLGACLLSWKICRRDSLTLLKHTMSVKSSYLTRRDTSV